MTLRDIVALLEGVRPKGSGFMARCPAHDDDRASLSIEEGNDGRILVKCFAGCDFGSIVAALGCRKTDFFAARTRPAAHNGSGPAANTVPSRQTVYSIRDRSGALVAEHVRLEDANGGKRFVWRRPDGTTGLGGVKAADLPLYGAHELSARPGEPVLLAEGERATDALLHRGFLAVGTVTGAAGVPSVESLSALEGRDVILWPDHDEPGRRHMRAVAIRLKGIATRIRLFTDAGATEGGDDAYDFFARGGSADALTDALLDAPEYRPEAADVALRSEYVEAAPREEDDAGRPPAIRPFTDLGNAERIVAAHGRDLRFCHPWGRWLVWDGRRWRIDDTAEPMRRAAATARAMYAEAADIREPQRRDALEAWARKSESRDRAKAMLEVAASIAGIPVLPDELDRHPFRLTVANGTIDLTTGRLGPHRRDDLMTMLAPVEFHADATCPTWDAFLDRNFAGDLGVIGYVQRMFGYSITGSTREHVFVICWGDGQNGKTTLIRTMLALLGGDLATTLPTSLFMAKKHDTHPTERALLLGKRLAVGVETAELGRLDEEAIKTLTGGDRIVARRMREDFWSYEPTAKLVLVTNHRPAIHGADHAIWRRVTLLPFIVTIPDGECDKTLPEKLRAELPGILNWAVRGCLAWQERGLDPPEAVRAATAEYRNASDIVGRFVAECCDLEHGTAESVGEVFGAFERFVLAEGETAIHKRTFGQRLRDRGFENRKGARGRREWCGLHLKNEARLGATIVEGGGGGATSD